MAPPSPTQSPTLPQPLTLAQREEILSQHIMVEARRGVRVHQRDSASATVVGPWVWLPVWLHLLLVLVTGGLWAPFWLAIAGPRARCAKQVWVDPFGRVVTQRVRV